MGGAFARGSRGFGPIACELILRSSAAQRQLLSSLPEGSIDKLRGVLWHRCADSGALEGEPFVQVCNVQRARTQLLRCQRASGNHRGLRLRIDDEADAERAYEALKRWVTSCGHKLAGAKREIYRDGLLEIQFPLA